MDQNLATAGAELANLTDQTDAFWMKVNVFPRDAKDRPSAYQRQAETALAECGRGNLVLLCQEMGLPYEPDGSAAAFLNQLLTLPASQVLHYLADFARGKDKAISEEYELGFSEKEQTGHAQDLDALTNGSGEKLKLLTKLVLLYLKQPSFVESVFFRHWWRRLRTVASYVSETSLPKDAPARVAADSSGLEARLKLEAGSRELRFFGHVQLCDGPCVFVIHREYKPSTKPDFRDDFKTLFSYGAVVFGIDTATGRLDVKQTGSRIVDAVKSWLEGKLGVRFRRRHPSTFSKYDPEKCQQLFLGAYDEGQGLRIIGVRFHRTTAPDHPPLTLESPYAGPSLKDALAHLHSRELLRLRSLADIDWIKLRYESSNPVRRFECLVEVTSLIGGAVEFSLDDSGIRESDRDAFALAFEKTFSLPLARLIDPKPIGVGKTAIYRSLLDTDLRSDVQAFQKDCLKDLQKLDLVTEETIRVRVCTTGYCESRGVPVHDRTLERCPRCRQELKVRGVRKLIHDHKKMIQLGGDILAKATGWDFGKQPIRFEKNDFYPLRNPRRPEETVCVFFDKRVNKAKIELFDRAAFPILVVHTSGDYEHAYLDVAGVAHLGFAFALAANADARVEQQFRQDCDKALQGLRERSHMRLQRAALQSRNTLRSKPTGYGGTEYESDIANLLHGIFPYVMKWGGKNSPDGFCSLLFFEENDLAKVTKFNWSYDTKFSDSPDGYDFGIAEKRQMFDYVSALMRQKRLQAQGDRLNAHVIISNNLDTSKMKDAASVLRKEHRLGKNHPELHLVFMMEDFLTTLHDQVHRQAAGFRRRWPYLSERLAFLMTRENDDGYVQLTAAEAQELVDWVLKQKEIEEPVEHSELRESLRETMSGN